VTCVLFARDEKRGSDSVYAAGWNRKARVQGSGFRVLGVRAGLGFTGYRGSASAGWNRKLRGFRVRF
jgi:hypothetical protein